MLIEFVVFYFRRKANQNPDDEHDEYILRKFQKLLHSWKLRLHRQTFYSQRAQFINYLRRSLTLVRIFEVEQPIPTFLLATFLQIFQKIVVRLISVTQNKQKYAIKLVAKSFAHQNLKAHDNQQELLRRKNPAKSLPMTSTSISLPSLMWKTTYLCFLSFFTSS